MTFAGPSPVFSVADAVYERPAGRLEDLTPVRALNVVVARPKSRGDGRGALIAWSVLSPGHLVKAPCKLQQRLAFFERNGCHRAEVSRTPDVGTPGWVNLAVARSDDGVVGKLDEDLDVIVCVQLFLGSLRATCELFVVFALDALATP